MYYEYHSTGGVSDLASVCIFSLDAKDDKHLLNDSAVVSFFLRAEKLRQKVLPNIPTNHISFLDTL